MMAKINQKIWSYIGRFLRYRDKISILLQINKLKKKNIFLFGCPIHPNMGDQAQTYCIEKWIRNNYTDFNVVHFSWNTSFPFALKLLQKKIKKDDIIIGHSGYFLIDHHRELPVYIKLAKLFTKNNIVILPQTINLKNDTIIKNTQEALNSHPNFTLLCRDEISYQKAKLLFSKCKLLLYPDIVTSLIGTMTFEGERKGILFCMRNDIEGYYKPSEIDSLRIRFHTITTTELSDTSIKIPFYKLKKQREKVLMEMIEKFSSYECIITDRYHGTIFSLIASTPVIVLSSADHKLSSGVNWFPPEFNKYIYFANDLDMAYDKAIEILEKKDIKNQLPPFFQKNYYSILKSKLDEIM